MSKAIWKKIGSLLVEKGLPLLGSAVAGPAGATVGAMVASTIGGNANDPDHLLKNLQQAKPDQVVALRKIESVNQVKLQALVTEQAIAEIAAETQRIQSVNQTMQVEARAGGWSGFWRPFWGVISALAWAFLAVCIGIVLVKNPTGLSTTLTAMSSLQFFWLIPLAILGVASHHRGKEKRVAAGEKPTNWLDGINALRGKKHG